MEFRGKKGPLVRIDHLALPQELLAWHSWLGDFVTSVSMRNVESSMSKVPQQRCSAASIHGCERVPCQYFYCSPMINEDISPGSDKGGVRIWGVSTGISDSVVKLHDG